MLCAHIVALCPLNYARLTAQQPFEAIELNIQDGILNRTLPFDVPFILHGTAPDMVTTVTAAIAAVPPLANPPAPHSNCAARTDLNTISQWRRPPPALSTTAAPQFRFLVPPLDVNVVYCMRFTLARQLPLTAARPLQDQTTAAIDEELRRLQHDDANMNSAQLEVLRQRLIAAVRPGTVAETLTAPPGTMFDPRDGEQMAQTFTNPGPAPVPVSDLERAQQNLAAHLQRVLDPQLQTYAILKSFEGSPTDATPGPLIANAVTSLTAIRDYLTANDELAQQLTAGLSEDTRPALQRIRNASGDRTTDLQNIAAGLAPNQGGPADNRLAGIWTVDSSDQSCRVSAVAGRVDTLSATAAFLDTLQTLVPDNAGDLGAAIVRTRDSVNASSEQLRTVESYVCERQAQIAAMTTNLVREARQSVSLLTTTSGTFAVRHPWYFGLDVGLAVAPTIHEVFPYLGINIYFRPVNKNALPPRAHTLWRRFSLLLGYTWTDNLLRSGQRVGLFARNGGSSSANAMMVLGGGYRFTDTLKGAGGVLFFKEPNPNPLIPDTSLSTTPFLSLSWDWDIVATIKDLGSLLGLGGGSVPIVSQ